MNPRPVTVSVLIVLFSLAAAPLPQDKVPGERSVPDPSTEAKKLVETLGSSDPAVSEKAYGSTVYCSPPTLAKMIELDRANQISDIARQRLHAAVAFRKPLERAAEDQMNRFRPLFECVRDQMIKSYDHGGYHSAKWDDDAHAGLGYFVARDLLLLPTSNLQFNCDLRSEYYLSRAIKAGCEDPAVLVAYAIKSESKSTPDETFNLIERADAADKVHTAGPYIKSLIDGRVLRHKTNPPAKAGQIQARLDDMVAQLKTMVADPAISPLLARDVARNIDDSAKVLPVDRGDWMAKYEPVLTKAYPDNAEILSWLGQFYVSWAWDGRGHADSRQTTPEQFKLFADRMARARRALERSWKLDPNLPKTCVAMLSVVLADAGNRQEMELWFGRGIALDPENYDIYYGKFVYLMPRWYGSPKELISFGRECLATELYRTKIPELLVRAHEDVSKLTEDPVAYYATPEVWQDITAVYERELGESNTPDLVRINYAETAASAHRWAEADELFKAVDLKKVKFTPEGQSKFDQLRALSAAEAAKLKG